jgi:hypothetical protein
MYVYWKKLGFTSEFIIFITPTYFGVCYTIRKTIKSTAQKLYAFSSVVTCVVLQNIKYTWFFVNLQCLLLIVHRTNKAQLEVTLPRTQVIHQNNNPKSAYALHILNNRDEYGTTHNKMELLKQINKTKLLSPYE